jgi:hypothetical protein
MSGLGPSAVTLDVGDVTLVVLIALVCLGILLACIWPER